MTSNQDQTSIRRHACGSATQSTRIPRIIPPQTSISDELPPGIRGIAVGLLLIVVASIAVAFVLARDACAAILVWIVRRGARSE